MILQTAMIIMMININISVKWNDVEGTVDQICPSDDFLEFEAASGVGTIIILFWATRNIFHIFYHFYHDKTQNKTQKHKFEGESSVKNNHSVLENTDTLRNFVHIFYHFIIFYHLFSHCYHDFLEFEAGE